jgi:ribonuclease R
MKPTRMPSKEELIAFIRDRSGKVGAREIARAFGAKNADRAAINRMLRELADDGSIERQRKRVHHAGTLPPVVIADITGRDSDGDLLARPAEWDEVAHGAPPVIHVSTPRRARPGEVAGVGDRALLRVEYSRDDDTTGRVIKLLDRAKHRVLGIFRALPNGSGRLVPVDKKQLGRELTIPVESTKDAADGDLVAVEVSRSGRLGQPLGSVIERLGSVKSERAVSLIAIHTHDIPHVFPRAVLEEAETAQPATLAGREDWRDVPFVTIDPPDAKDHDDAVHAVPDADPRNHGGHIVNVAIADVAHYVLPGDQRSIRRSATSAATRSISPTASCRCCRRHIVQRAVLAAPARSPPCHRRAHLVIDRDGRKLSRTRFHARDDPLGRSETALRAGPARSRPARSRRCHRCRRAKKSSSRSTLR